MKAVKRFYVQAHEEGEVSTMALDQLLNTLTHTIEMKGGPMDEWKELKALIVVPDVYVRYQNYIPGALWRNLLFDHLQFGYEVVSAFVAGREETIKLLSHLLKGDRSIRKAVRKECEESRQAAHAALKNLRESFPEVAVSIQTKLVAR